VVTCCIRSHLREVTVAETVCNHKLAKVDVTNETRAVSVNLDSTCRIAVDNLKLTLLETSYKSAGTGILGISVSDKRNVTGCIALLDDNWLYSLNTINSLSSLSNTNETTTEVTLTENCTCCVTLLDVSTCSHLSYKTTDT
jgi:hypothetical protein